MEAAEQALQDSPAEVAKHLGRAKQLARESLHEARRSVWNLRSRALLERPLEAVLEGEVKQLADEGAVRASFHLKGAKRRLPPHVEDNLLRFCRESLTNVRRHAAASEVQVELSFSPEAVCLRVRDDGVGFDPDAAKASAAGRFGLAGMAERARLLGGQLTVTSQKAEGTLIELRTPLPLQGTDA